MTVPGTASYMCADSLKYMEIGDFDGVLESRKDYCFACFDLDYIYPPEHYGIKVNVPLDRE